MTEGPKVYRVISNPFLEGFSQTYSTYRVRIVRIEDTDIWYDERPEDIIRDRGWSFIRSGEKCVLCEHEAEDDYICPNCLANRHS